MGRPNKRVENNAILFITWTKLLVKQLKPAIEKMGMQVAQMVQASLEQSIRIDNMQDSVSNNQLEYITKAINFCRNPSYTKILSVSDLYDGLYEIAEHAADAVPH